MQSRLLCTDMDRALISNGCHAESPRVRELVSRFVRCPDVSLAYVTGRHLELVQSAIVEDAFEFMDHWDYAEA
ncbi:HAD family hydrolase [Magnetovibrio sp. PR-2]|uniref:HAD family hydrolase n=1 Tax=Magnetovibrio sp. PR-2 TaxID=3120356 RepID=UPI002FCDF54A